MLPLEGNSCFGVLANTTKDNLRFVVIKEFENHRGDFHASQPRSPVRSRVLRMFLAARGTVGSDQEERRRTRERLQRANIKSIPEERLHPSSPGSNPGEVHVRPLEQTSRDVA